MVVNVAATAADDSLKCLCCSRHSRVLARGANRRQPSFDRCGDRRRLRASWISHRLRKVGGANEENIDSIYLQNLVDICDCFLMLKLHADKRSGVSVRCEVRHATAKTPAVGSRTRC